MAAATKLKKTILGIAIALVLVFFLGYSVYTFYKEPRLDDICKGIESRIEVESCAGYETPTPDTEELRPVPVSEDVPAGKYCNCYQIDKEGTLRCEANNPKYDECSDTFEKINEKHSRYSFIILVILGLASILIGGLLIRVEAVGSGIMGGGVLTIIYAAMRYWGSIQDYGRLLILGLTLAILVYIGYKKLKD